MIPRSINWAVRPSGIPRMSGDDPEKISDLEKIRKYSPHERG